MNARLLLVFTFLLVTTYSWSQTFSNNNSISLPDENTAVVIPVQVSGLSNAINSTFGLTQVCLTLDHPFIGQLVAVLKSPNGSDSVRLLWHDGGNSVVNQTICFTEAANNFIATYPVTGVNSYFGEDDNNIMNNGRDPNGTWQLIITDIVPGYAGTFNGISISFGNNPPPTHNRIFGCSLGSPWGCECPDGSDTCELLPDMTNARASLLRQYGETATEIRFAVATPNIGAGPLEMNGSSTQCFCDTTPVACGTTCPTGQELKHTVKQKIYKRSGNGMTTYERDAGQMELHPTHNHIHVDHWTNNTLRIKSKDPNPTNWPIIGTAYKISFCLINLGSCDSYPNYCVDNNGNVLQTSDIPNYNFGNQSGCGLKQGIYPGKVDEYGAGLEGQSISLDGLCNGNYYLVSITDPENAVKESDENNNYAYIPVKLNQRPCNSCSANFYADTLHGVDSLTVHFTDSTIAIPDSWRWDFGDGTTDTVQFPTHKYTQPGVYTVQLRTTASLSGGNICKDTAVKTAYITITESPRPEPPITDIFINASPNPFKDYLNLYTNSKEDLNVNVEVYDLMGRKISNQLITSFNKNNSPRQVSSQSFGVADGLYFIRLSYNGTIKTMKVIKSSGN
jgi:PKD repeat protein